MKRSKSLVILVTMMLVIQSILLCGCGKEKKTEECTKYIWGTAAEPGSFNPDAVDEPYGYAISQNVYSRLVKVTNEYKVVPDLAESWQYENDNKTLVFYLRKNVKWHDGEPFTSADVKFTFDTIKSENGLMASSFENVSEIVCPDDYTVNFELSKADASVLGSLSWYATFIMPKHIYEGTDWLNNEYNEKPIGTGPFKFKEWNKGSSIVLERNDDYFGDKPKLSSVVYQIIPDENTAYTAWMNGEIDQYDEYPLSEVSKFENDDNYYYVDQLNPNITYLTFNLEDPVFSNPKMRQVIAMAMDREEILEKAAKGVGKVGEYFIPSIYESYLNEDAKAPALDREGAQKLLEELGYTKDADGYYLEINFEYAELQNFGDVAKVVQSNLDKIGIKVNLKQLDFAVWEDTVFNTREFSMTVLNGFQGPDVFGTTARYSGDSVNLSRYSNNEVNDLIQEALQSDEETAKQCFKDIQTHLAQDLPNIPLIEKVDHKPYKAYIKGHPAKDSADKAGFDELTYTYIEK